MLTGSGLLQPFACVSASAVQNVEREERSSRRGEIEIGAARLGTSNRRDLRVVTPTSETACAGRRRPMSSSRRRWRAGRRGGSRSTGRTADRRCRTADVSARGVEREDAVVVGDEERRVVGGHASEERAALEVKAGDAAAESFVVARSIATTPSRFREDGVGHLASLREGELLTDDVERRAADRERPR